MNRIRCIAMYLIGILGMTISCLSAQAADTAETFDVGASDVESYLGLEGIGHSVADREAYGDLMIGYGLVPSFSAYVGTTLVGNGYLANGSAALYLGIFGTPLDTDHIDLDLFLDACGEDEAFSQFGLTPAVELNLDLDPEMRSLGSYIRISERLSGGERAEASILLSDEAPQYKTFFETGFVLGAYYSLLPEHQLLLEYDMCFNHTPQNGDRRLGVGSIALGYNFVLIQEIEAITQAALDIPQGEEKVGVSAMIGFIATVPAGSSHQLVNKTKPKGNL